MRSFYYLKFCFWLILGTVLLGPLCAQENDVYRSHVKPASSPTSQLFVDPNVVPTNYFADDDSEDTKDSTAAATVTAEEKALKEEKSEAKDKRDDVAEQIRVAEAKKEKQELRQEQTQNSAAPVEINPKEALRLRLLKQLDVILAQREQQLATLEDVKKELSDRNETKHKVANGDLGLEKPYSFLLLDQLQDELSALKSNLASNQSNQAITNVDIVQAKQSLEAKEQAYRLAKENKEIAATNLASDGSSHAIEVKLATETLDYRKRRLDIIKLQAEIHEARIKTAETKLATIRRNAVFSEDDLNSKLAELEKRDGELRSKLKNIDRAMERSDEEWLSDRLFSKTKASPTPKDAQSLELRRFQRQALQATVTSINFRLELLSQSRQVWESRYQFSNSLSTSQQDIEFEKTAIRNLKQRDRDLANKLIQLDDLRKSIATLDTKIESFPNEGDGLALRRLIDQQKDAVRLRMVTFEEDVAAIQASRRVTEKLLADIQGDAGRYSLAKLWESTCYYAQNIWNTELTIVDERPITIGKVFMALAIFVGGFWLARFISRRLRDFMAARLKVDQSASAAFQSLAFYGLVTAFLLGALNFVGIPLTVFTFLGGALAIGVGFGSQNILSNFISGLILLAERPVKVGDLIQMDEFYGIIETIGARSTIVRTATNLCLIVPNSKFLETNVMNLTHGSNDLIRTHVAVGVQYGSSTRQVTKLLKQAAADHGLVLKDPEPFVLFKEFGDNALNFELHFWINVTNPLDRLKMQSDVRYRIDSLFSEAGVVISFPQRDVHVDSHGPIDIRLVGAEDLGSAGSSHQNSNSTVGSNSLSQNDAA